MVISAGYDWLLFAADALNENAPTKATTLPEPVRQIAYMALLGIALLGMLMIVATLLGGHWVRRWGDRVRRPPVPPDVLIPRQEKTEPPKTPDDDASLDDASLGDTLGGNDTTIA